jgi:hypothetical protein
VAESIFRGRGRALGSGEAEYIFRGRGGGRALGSGEAETSPEAEAQGRARRSFLWRLRLDSAAVSLTLAGGTAVGAGQAALLSYQVGQWKGEVTCNTLNLGYKNFFAHTHKFRCYSSLHIFPNLLLLFFYRRRVVIFYCKGNYNLVG